MPTVQTFWGGRRITPYEILCLRSFTAAGHTVDLYTYNYRLVPRLPDVRIRDASEILPSREYREEADWPLGHPGIFSDHFRYKLLYERGGWWVDTDVILLGKLPDRHYYFAYQDEDRVNNAVMRFPSQSHIMKECLWFTKEARAYHPLWGDTGPDLLTRETFDLSAAPIDDCYPIRQEEIHKVFQFDHFAEVTERLKSATFLHLWNAVLAIDKWDYPPEGSWISRKVENLFGLDEWTIWRNWESGWRQRERASA